MHHNQKFTDFLSELSLMGEKELLESIIAGYSLLYEANEPQAPEFYYSGMTQKSAMELKERNFRVKQLPITEDLQTALYDAMRFSEQATHNKVKSPDSDPFVMTINASVMNDPDISVDVIHEGSKEERTAIGGDLRRYVKNGKVVPPEKRSRYTPLSQIDLTTRAKKKKGNKHGLIGELEKNTDPYSKMAAGMLRMARGVSNIGKSDDEETSSDLKSFAP